jgi:hypothetical protein
VVVLLLKKKKKKLVQTGDSNDIVCQCYPILEFQAQACSRGLVDMAELVPVSRTKTRNSKKNSQAPYALSMLMFVAQTSGSSSY